MQVTASCKCCNTPFGAVRNQWRQVTGSYYLEADATRSDNASVYARRDSLDLVEQGSAKAAGSKNALLRGCLVQALACRSCSDCFAFEVIAAPPRLRDPFKNRIFLKLSKIHFKDTETDQPVSASLARGSEVSNDFLRIGPNPEATQEPFIPRVNRHTSLAEQQLAEDARLSSIEGPSASSTVRNPEMPAAIPRDSFTDADNEAAREILAKATWQDVHDNWEQKTKLTLSPASFGNRILPVVDRHRKLHDMEKSKPAQRELPPPQRPEYRPAEPRAVANGTHQSEQLSGSRYQSRRPDSLELQRADISRIDAAVSDMQSSIRDLTGMINTVRQEVKCRPQRSNEDSNTLNLLSDTVGQMASKTGEIDAIKFNVANLTRRLKALEESSSPTSTASYNENSYTRPSPSVGYGPHVSQPVRQSTTPLPQSQSLAAGAPGWTSMNSQHSQSPGHQKRKSFSMTDSDGSHSSSEMAKRPRPAHMHQASNVSREGTIQRHNTLPAPGPPTLAPIRALQAESQESWASESQRLPSIHGIPTSNGSVRPADKRGLRAASADDLGTPAWERESWNESQALDADGYYRPLGGVPLGPISPTTAERRGNIVRRTTGGGLHYMDPNFNNKRTRQKPVRNSEGVLIRKDGKPDQRSISSPQNLKKVHARKVAEQDSSTGPHFTSPLANSRHSSQEVMSGSSGEVSVFASPTQEEHPREVVEAGVDKSSAAQHHAIMGKMFPHGVAADAERMNHAAHLFSAVNAPKVGNGHPRASTLEAQPRSEMMHDDVHSQHQRQEERATSTKTVSRQDSGDTVHSNESEPMDVDDNNNNDSRATAGRSAERMPPPRSEHLQSESAASGSVYEPSQTQDSTTESTKTGSYMPVSNSSNTGEALIVPESQTATAGSA